MINAKKDTKLLNVNIVLKAISPNSTCILNGITFINTENTKYDK